MQLEGRRAGPEPGRIPSTDASARPLVPRLAERSARRRGHAAILVAEVVEMTEKTESR